MLVVDAAAIANSAFLIQHDDFRSALDSQGVHTR